MNNTYRIVRIECETGSHINVTRQWLIKAMEKASHELQDAVMKHLAGIYQRPIVFEPDIINDGYESMVTLTEEETINCRAYGAYLSIITGCPLSLISERKQ